jgi:Transglycosylase
MTAGSSWESAPTSPLPAGPYLGDPGQYPGVPAAPGWPEVPEVPGVPGAPDWPGAPGMARGTGRARRRHRWLARCFATILGLVLIAALALGGLLLVTPSVGDAPARAMALDMSHHVAYPGPAVPARFTASLVSTEDHRFYYEPGIDPLAVGRLALGKITGRPDQGGATLYQQLAKMLYTQGHTGILVDAEQVGLGIKLDVTYSKAQILRMYADVVYFGHGYYGLAAASCGYFGVAPARLTWPIVHLRVARARESHVLGRLVATGKLTQAQATSAYRQPLGLVGGSGTGCAGQ